MSFGPATAELLPFPQPEGNGLRFIQATGTWERDEPDGGVVIFDHNPEEPERGAEDEEHDANLAEQLDDDVLASIAMDLLEGIEEDNNSRAAWLATREKAIDLLGLKIESPRGDAGTGAAIEGMSTVRHPLFLEACVRFQANARGELLPADGPAKVKNAGPGTSEKDAAGAALEEAVNSYLTDTASEYYPDTDKLLFQTGMSGAGIKKGYHCPIRRRPVIEAVDAKDIVVSNTATDLDSAGRITHIIDMSPATLKRMQLAKAYLDVDLSTPEPEVTGVDRNIAATQGISKGGNRPQDLHHTIFECHCDYDIPGFEHEQDGEKTGLPLPYKITIDKTSRKILEIRRNYAEDDETLKKRRTFIMYQFVPMFGFWPYGLLHLLGNTTNAITAAWRIVLDNGMYNNFATFLYAKGATNNETPNFRASPGTGIPIDCPQGRLSDAVMPVPYKQTDPSFMAFIDNVAATGQRLGGTAEAQIGEGNQQAPVGTTLAMIEQAQKIMSAVHKRIHAAQALEFKMLKELLQEDPDALWRHRRDGSRPDNAGLILQALNDYDLIPVADPNSPSHMHRTLKTMGLAQRADTHPERYDAIAVETEILRTLNWDNPQQFLSKPVEQAPPNPLSDPNVAKTMGALAMTKMKGDQSLQIAQLKVADATQSRQVKLLDIQQRARDNAAKLAAARENKVLDITHSLAVHPQSLEQINQGQQP